MAEVIVSSGTRQVIIGQVTPNIQASTASAAVVVGSDMDMRPWRSLSYTILNADQTITWWVYGANAANFSDEVIVDGPSDVLASGIDSYDVQQAPYAYYRVKIIDKVGGVHGNCRVVGVAKY
jgi:hypothetical protein